MCLRGGEDGRTDSCVVKSEAILIANIVRRLPASGMMTRGATASTLSTLKKARVMLGVRSSRVLAARLRLVQTASTPETATSAMPTSGTDHWRIKMLYDSGTWIWPRVTRGRRRRRRPPPPSLSLPPSYIVLTTLAAHHL